MKTKIAMSLIAITFAIVMIGSVSAMVGESFSTKLVQKDSSWNVIDDGLQSTLYGYQTLTTKYVKGVKTYTAVDYLSLIPSGKVKPNTSYTLVYYGYGSHNDEWNYVTCIANGKSSSQGYLSLKGKFAWSKFLDDGADQKFWLVESKDLKCGQHQFKNWNPENYLFESETI